MSKAELISLLASQSKIGSHNVRNLSSSGIASPIDISISATRPKESHNDHPYVQTKDCRQQSERNRDSHDLDLSELKFSESML
jgi:hypothetical protein